MCLFCYFNFEINYEILKLKNPCVFVQKYKLHKNETESLIKNSTHSFREMNLALQLI